MKVNLNEGLLSALQAALQIRILWNVEANHILQFGPLRRPLKKLKVRVIARKYVNLLARRWLWSLIISSSYNLLCREISEGIIQGQVAIEPECNLDAHVLEIKLLLRFKIHKLIAGWLHRVEPIEYYVYLVKDVGGNDDYLD